ncbi:hypothetical protein ATL42_2387 [Sanguibacter antarcticus]|uniref:RapA2 cadherin-like domain-containing protein n=1 Tax=Sanguibacter antarcticus TaxID=372484 RepID=A0A2A9E5Y7_9MICO|nr:hypothetical protein ATL42_2387 [Sanguibacter antarcticus]
MRATTFTTTGLRTLLATVLSLAPVLVFPGTASAADDETDDEVQVEACCYDVRPPPPWVLDDAYVTEQDVPLESLRTGRSILDNDSQFEKIDAFVRSEPAHGTVEMVEDGHFVYVPAPGFQGTDSFTYVALDDYGQESYEPATITVTVRPADQALTTAPDVFETPAGVELVVAAPGYLGNDVSPGGLPVTQASVTPVVPAAAGSAVHSADGAFVYTPSPGFQGSASFTYVATDGAVHALPQTVTVRVVGATPEATDDAYVLDEDTTLVAESVLANDVGPVGSVLTAATVTAPSHGGLDLAPDGTFTYTPEPDFEGTDTFTYAASDGTSASPPGTVTLTVDPVEDFPPVAVDDAYTIEQDTTINIRNLGLSILDNDVTDVAAVAVLVTGSVHGTTYMHPDGMFVYQPDSGFHGTDSFTYLTRTGSDSDVATVTLTVRAADRALVGSSDSYQTPIGVELAVAAPGVLVNDSSPDGLPLSVTIAEQPDHGSIVLDADGAFRYVPSPGFQGLDWFAYTLTDGLVQKRVQMSVRMVGPSPVAVDDSHSLLEDNTYVATWGILHNDISSDGRPLTALKVSDPAHGTVTVAPDGIFTYVPDKDFNGTDSFTYLASDGTTSSAPATVMLTVRPDDEAPTVAVPVRNLTTVQGTPLTGRMTVINPDNLTLEYRGYINRHPPGGSVVMDDATGEWTFTPVWDFVGATYVETEACDTYLGRCVKQGLRITVTPAAQVIVTHFDTYELDEDTTLVAGSILANDVSSAGTPLSATLVNGPSYGVVSLAPDGTFTYTPDPGFHGMDAFSYVASDGTTSSIPTGVSMSVRAVDKPPSFAVPTLAVAAVEDTPTTGEVTAINPDGLTLTYTAVSVGTPGGSVVMDASTGAYTFTPDQDFVGLAQVDVEVCAPDGPCATQRLDLTVSSVADAPVAADQTVVTTWGKAVKGTFTVSDVDSPTLTFAVTSAPQRGKVAVDPAARTFVYTPAWWSTGDDSFVVTVCDPDGLCDSARVTVDLRRSWWMPSSIPWLDAFVTTAR